ncbi:SAM-dependent methyltransferase [Amycolatopsis sp. K13G38]|uniref:SAM-dependent methyltransferase n=1 Tax=Amycolatopsis acididurans TaxID=2724524 RepID=A0ABX1JG90_9PSEU|nr:SAM-dependent methyltransferase [Amycolatopsis acididurans]NKQ58701.1 SAM-dependent methyltransferase [Amycolatopsis acididurans]
MILHPIGYVRSPRSEPVDDDWDSVTARVELDGALFGPSSLQGLEEFSHVEIVYVFDRVTQDKVQRSTRRPRGNPDWPSVGIFAQRAKNRPNRIGVTCCRLLDVDGLTIKVRALDAIDGSPVLDIKPYMTEFGPREPVEQPSWSTELMSTYWATPARA